MGKCDKMNAFHGVEIVWFCGSKISLQMSALLQPTLFVFFRLMNRIESGSIIWVALSISDPLKIDCSIVIEFFLLKSTTCCSKLYVCTIQYNSFPQ